MNTECFMFWLFITLDVIFLIVFIWGLIEREKDYGGVMMIIGVFFLVIGSLIMWSAIGVESCVYSKLTHIEKTEVNLYVTPVNTTVSYRNFNKVFENAGDINDLKDTSLLYFYEYEEKNIYNEIIESRFFYSYEQLHELKEN